MKIPIAISKQPDESTCGPTCLHSVYSYYNYNISLDSVIQSVQALEDGGTLAVLLGIDALKNGFEAKLYTYNLRVFDPTWSGLTNTELIKKLEDQLKVKKGKKFFLASNAYIEFLKSGGKISFENFSTKLIKRYLKDKIPILTGLSATFLYQTAREYFPNQDRSVYDDIKGDPVGHFVVLCGIKGNKIYIADPYQDNPFTNGRYYEVDIERLISAILLGVITYDANLLIITPSK